MEANTITCGPAKEVLQTFPDESINCAISSPPYWALRDYGVDGQLGLEPTFEEYIDKLCTIYDEVKRVLTKDGCCFVNLGDTYWGAKGQSGQGSPEYQAARQDISLNKPASHIAGQKLTRPQDMQHDILQAKSLCLIPQRFAIEMVNRGWILRNVIIWSKPNPMPSSAKDRFTVDFEYVFFFVKSKCYFFEPQYEPQTGTAHSKGGKLHPPIEDAGVGHKDWHKYTPLTELPLGRNKRTTWIIPTEPCPEAHFATFPHKLVEPMILAGCPEFVCKKCGKGRRKVYEKGDIVPDAKGYRPRGRKGDNELVNRWNTGEKELGPNMHYEQTFKGYSDCGCNAGWRPGVMCDPFAGLVAPARWRPNTEGTISELMLSLIMLKISQSRMLKKLKQAYQ